MHYFDLAGNICSLLLMWSCIILTPTLAELFVKRSLWRTPARFMTYLLIVLFFLLFILPCTIIIFWLIHCYKKDFLLSVYDGKWDIGSNPHPHWRDKVLVIQSCWWELCFQQREGSHQSMFSSFFSSTLRFLNFLRSSRVTCLFSVIIFNQIYKVPATDMEALKSPLMGLFEKRRARNFFIYVQDYNEADPRTHQGLDLTRVTTRELIA